MQRLKKIFNFLEAHGSRAQNVLQSFDLVGQRPESISTVLELATKVITAFSNYVSAKKKAFHVSVVGQYTRTHTWSVEARFHYVVNYWTVAMSPKGSSPEV